MPRQRSESSRSTGSMRRQSSRSSHVFATKPSRGSSKDLPAVQQPKKESHPAASAAPSTEAKGPGAGERFKDMATTAAGVAAGSAVGHAVGAGLTGMFQGRGQAAPAKEQPQQEGSMGATASQSAPRPQLVEDGPCAFELRQFLKCTEENSGDLSVCREFNEAMQHCRRRYNV